MRAIESASYAVVEFLLEQGAKVTQENIQGKTAFDLAKDFADPRVYFAVKNKFESLPKPKDNKKNKKKPEKKKKKGEEENLKDDFLPQITLRRGSFSNAEALLARSSLESERIVYRPLHVWTEQDTTQQLLERKNMYREKYGWEIDFDDYKLPFIKNVNKKIEKMGGIE
jgi:hypothetical protein